MRYKFLLSALLAFFASCQKVIQVDLNSAAPTLVVEAAVTDQSIRPVVKLTQTTDYFNPSLPPAVTGAIVTISDDAGNKEIMTEEKPGFYYANKINGVGGRTYFLSVQTGGKEYTAHSFLNPPIPLDSLTYQKDDSPQSAGGKKRYVVLAHFHDPVGKGNGYRFQTQITQAASSTDTSNAKPDLSYRLFTDRLQDGENINYQIRRTLELNDQMQVVMYSFDQNVYDYYFTLSQITGGQQAASAAPSNPNTNIKGGALGYFGALSFQIKTITIR